MKLPWIVPGMLRATQGMRRGPETTAAAPCDLLPGLQHAVDGVGCPECIEVPQSRQSPDPQNKRKTKKMMNFL